MKTVVGILSCLIVEQLLYSASGQVPEIAFLATSQNVTVGEDTGSGMFCVVLVEDGVDPPALPGLQSSLSVALEFNTSGGTPLATYTGSGAPPDDLLLSSTQLLFNIGTMEGDSVCITVTGISDDDVEGTEYLAVNIESNSSYIVNGGGAALTDSVTIIVLDADIDGGMQIMINATGSDVTAVEGDIDQQQICVETMGVGVLTTPVIVAFALSGDATLADIQGFTVPILEAGVNDPSSCALFTILDDDLLEGDHELTFTIFDFIPASEIAIRSPRAHVFTIKDNEDLAVIAMQEETPFCATITGLPAGGLDTDIVVDFEVADLTAVAGEDYIVNSSTVMAFTSGTTSNGSRVCVDIILPEDDVYEEDERFTISITSVSPTTAAVIGPQSSFTIKLEDNEDAEVVFVMTEYNISEDSGSITLCVDSGVTEGFEVALTVILSAESDTASVIDDISLPDPLQVIFSVGQTVSTSCIDIPIVNDANLENIEDFLVTIITAGSPPYAVVRSPFIARVTIEDDEVVSLAFVKDGYSVEEGDSVSICVDSGVVGTFEVDLTVELRAEDGTASVTDDISLPDPLQVIFSFGQTVSTSCIAIPIRRDTELEDDEHFTVIIASEVSTPSVTTVTIVDKDGFCRAEIRDDKQGYGEYRWSESKVGTADYQICVYSGFGDHPMASRPCNEGEVWGDVVYDECFTLSTSMYQEIAIENTTEVNIVEVVSEIEELVGNTTSTLDQSQMNFDVITGVVNISREIITDTNLESEDVVEIVDDVVDIVDTVIDWPEQGVEQSGSFLIETYEELASILAQRNDTNTTDNVVLSKSGENSAIIIERPPLRELSNDGRTFSVVNEDGVLTGTSRPTKGEDDMLPIASITLPPELFQGLRENRDTAVGLVFTAYTSSILFPLANTSDIPPNRSIRTPVIGAIVVGQNETENLTEPVLIDLTILRENDDEVFMSAVCVSWDFRAAGDRGNWTDRGCETEYTPGSCRVLCKCSHLTNFAALVDICSRTDDDCRLSRKDETALTVISILGATLSIIGLVLTIITMLAFKKMRDRDVSKFHTQLSLALLGMLLVFVIGIDRTEVLGGCVFVSVLIHYFTLSAMMWMGAEALLMFQKLVRVFVQTTTRQIVIISLICWLVPILLVVVPLSIDPHFMVSSEDVQQQVNQGDNCGTNAKRTEIKFCFIGKPAVFFVTFLTPVLTVFIFNGVIFVLVTKVIFQHSFMSMSAKSKSKRSIKQTKRFILSLFGIMTLFGLTWIFAAFTISGASTAFQYLFAICNSLQGFLIFIFFSVIPKDARQSWVDLLFYLKLHKRPLPKSPTWKFHGKGGMHLRNKKTSSTIDKSNTDTLKRISTQSELITLRRSSEEYSSSTGTVPPRDSLDPISENEDSHTETEMKKTSLAISDNILMREADSEVIFNHAALDSIIEEDHDVEDQASIHTDSVPPQQQVDANTAHDLSVATENVFQSNIYPSLPEVDIESDGLSVTANEKQSVSENILMREAVSEVIFNHAALGSITETTEEDRNGEDQATDSVPPQQQADANTGHDLSMATENVQEVNVFQSNIYPSLPEVDIESDGLSAAANEKQSVAGGRAVAPE